MNAPIMRFNVDELEDLLPRVKLHLPSMPTLHELQPLLQEIEQSAVYTNQGPLCRRLERSLAKRVAGEEGAYAVALSNATLALELALKILCRDSRHGTCLVPAWTFAATAHAVVRAGLTPIFIDVDASTWMLQPAAVLKYLAQSGSRPAAVMVVSPFGAPIPTDAWDDFSASQGIPVLFDAAAGIDRAQHSRFGLSVYSMHATKPIASGEGGVVISADESLIEHIRGISNFGFDQQRKALYLGTNAKLSEYHAAVGLASIDRWASTRRRLVEIAAIYLSKLAAHPRIQFQEGWGTDWLSTSLNIKTPIEVDELAGFLINKGVEARSWWNGVLTEHPAFDEFRCASSVDCAVSLSRHVIGLPFHAFLTDKDVHTVCDAVLECIDSEGVLACV